MMLEWVGRSAALPCLGDPRAKNRKVQQGVKGVGEGVMERRIDWGFGYRVYFAWDGITLIILLGGGTKIRQAADIKAAKARWQDYRKRKTRS
jgi:putative addiction module killer protein